MGHQCFLAASQVLTLHQSGAFLNDFHFKDLPRISRPAKLLEEEFLRGHPRHMSLLQKKLIEKSRLQCSLAIFISPPFSHFGPTVVLRGKVQAACEHRQGLSKLS